MVNYTPVKCMFLFGLLTFVVTSKIWAQSEHQRLVFENKKNNVITPTLDVSYTYSDYNNSYVYGFRSNLGIQYVFKNRFFFLFSFPFYLQLVCKEDSKGWISLANGDVNLSLGYMTKWLGYKMRFYLGYVYPTGIWNSYEVEEKRIKSGGGYHVLSIATEVAKIIDPVVIGSVVSYAIDLPRKERFGWSMTLGRLNLSFNYTEVLNDKIGIRIRMENTVSFPSILGGRVYDNGISYRLSFVFSLLYNQDDSDFQFGVSKVMTDVIGYPSVVFSVSHDFGF